MNFGIAPCGTPRGAPALGTREGKRPWYIRALKPSGPELRSSVPLDPPKKTRIRNWHSGALKA